MNQPLTASVRYLSGEREPVRVATTGNITLQGLLTIDDVELEVGDRVLVKNQTDQTQNGIYLASEGRWFRAPDASYTRAINDGVTVAVQEGTASNGRTFRFSTVNPVIGTDPIALTYFLSDTLSEDVSAAAASAAVAATQPLVAQAENALSQILSITETLQPFGVITKVVGGPVQSIDTGNPGAIASQINLYLDGVYQNKDTWTVTGGVITPVEDEWPTTTAEAHFVPAVSADFIPADGSVTTPKLADEAVTRPKLGIGSVGEDQLDPAIVDLLNQPGDITLSARLAALEAIIAQQQQVPSEFLSARFLQVPGYKIRRVVQEKGRYNAFPRGLRRFGKDIVAIYSSGLGHGNSDHHPWVKSDNGFLTFEKGIFRDGGVYDNSFLEGLVAPGESHNFGSIWTAKNVGGVFQNFQTSVIDVTSTDPYALWGEPVFIDGIWYATAYRTAGGYRRPALFRSTDGMETWQFVVLIAAVGSKELSETTIVDCANGDWLAVIRNDTNPSVRALDVSRSTNSGATWSTPTTLPSNMVGTQPFLLKLSNGHILLFVGDRTGGSGLSNAGLFNDVDDITGIMVYKSTNNGASWGAGTQLAASWSNDCGQPQAVEMADGTVGVMCYLSPGNTSGTRGVEPGIYWIEFDPSGI